MNKTYNSNANDALIVKSSNSRTPDPEVLSLDITANQCVHCYLELTMPPKFNACDTALQKAASKGETANQFDTKSPKSGVNNQKSTQLLEVPAFKAYAPSMDMGISRHKLSNEHIGNEIPRTNSINKQLNNTKTNLSDPNNPKPVHDNRLKGSTTDRNSIINSYKTLSGSDVTIYRNNPISNWMISAKSKEHIWFLFTKVLSKCHVVGCKNTYKHFKLMKCSLCKLVACDTCRTHIKYSNCVKTFFTSCEIKSAAEGKLSFLFRHFWIHKNYPKQKCHTCRRSIAKQNLFHRGPACIQCAWCKRCYHNKPLCFTKIEYQETCDLGLLKDVIIHPIHIQKLSNATDETDKSLFDDFNITPKLPRIKSGSKNATLPEWIRTALCLNPILVLVNPKSGGKNGLEVMQYMQWLLNPRQVFDITHFSLKNIFSLYRRFSDIRLIVGGGDGSINSVLRAVESHREFSLVKPPIGIIPLGTGNDLANELHWGSSYGGKDTLEALLLDLVSSPIQKVDIWNVSIRFIHLNNNMRLSCCCNDDSSLLDSASQEYTPNTLLNNEKIDLASENVDTEFIIEDDNPLDINDKFINYLSVGTDAAIALSFDLARKKNSKRFNSRFENNLFYLEHGGLDLFKQEFKNLVDYISLTCDNVSYDEKLAQLRPHSILALNITKYSAGTNPWGKHEARSSFSSRLSFPSHFLFNKKSANTSDDYSDGIINSFQRSSPMPITQANFYMPQVTDDGLLEIIGLTNTTLATLHLGGQGDRICQCHTVRIEIQREVPVQMDGEPILLKPCIIEIEHFAQYPFVKRTKTTK